MTSHLWIDLHAQWPNYHTMEIWDFFPEKMGGGNVLQTLSKVRDLTLKSTKRNIGQLKADPGFTSVKSQGPPNPLPAPNLHQKYYQYNNAD